MSECRCPSQDASSCFEELRAQYPVPGLSQEGQCSCECHENFTGDMVDAESASSIAESVKP